jgi:hypothetical protein
VGWEDLTPSQAVEKADWIAARLHPFAAYDVGSVIPTGFAAYARILHPAWRWREGDSRGTEVRWSEVAEWSGKTIHPEVQFHAIATPTPGRDAQAMPWSQEPRDGVLSELQVVALAGLLSRHTTTRDICWFCYWDGYGDLHPGGLAPLTFTSVKRPSGGTWLRGPRVHLGFRKRSRRPRVEGRRVTPNPQRSYLLFKGSVAKAAGWQDGPNLWWPDDQAWCVASEIDHSYSYVAGSNALIKEVLAHPALEALPASVGDGIVYSSDRIN